MLLRTTSKSHKQRIWRHIFDKKHIPPVQYSEGEFVVTKNVDNTIGTNKKLVPKFKGPYRIHKVLLHDRYVIRDIENGQISQLPYDGIVEAARIKRWADWRDSDDKKLEDIELHINT